MNFRALGRRAVGILAVAAVAAAVLTAAPALVAPTESADAAAASDFNPGKIISDAEFYNSSSMNAGDVQAFLNTKGANCVSNCLKDYRQTTDNRPADNYCRGYSRGVNETAADIIDKVARSCGISQQVLLVLLEKEQSLITSRSPGSWAYQAATGQGCPDTAPCDASTSGFFYQVYYGARQYQVYRLNPNLFGYQAGRWNTILLSPNRNCGTKQVYIENQATAGLYIYTPYTPNQAALNNLYGSGDGCSTYGNRNFWRMYTDWFGNQEPERAPFGGYNIVVERGQFTVQGWAIDPDNQKAALTISVTMDATPNWKSFTANASRPDVGAVYPAAGNNHGMNATFGFAGKHTVCVTAKNVGRGIDKNFGCSTIDIPDASPIGGNSVEVIPGGIHMTGWTLDTDSPTKALAVHVYVDGKGTAYTANASRPDVGQVFPGTGTKHGIDLKIQLAAGTHEVCAWGINVGRGDNKLLGCNTVKIESASPFGYVDSVVAEPGGFRIKGWTIDPNTTKPIGVHVYANGKPAAVTTASGKRADVGRDYPKYGAGHGFDLHVDAKAGSTQVCAYGINVSWGGNTGLGCKTVQVLAGGAPFGGMDVTMDGNTGRLRGWTIDPDTTKSIPVHVYIDGVGTAITANASRPDVANVYPAYGDKHGIDWTFELKNGTHTICAYGIDSAGGTNTQLGCETVRVVDAVPIGGTDITMDGSTARMRGWTIDPDTKDAIDVHVYANGKPVAVTTANKNRPDVGQVYPAYGSKHGIDVKFTLPKGRSEVCSYAINRGAGPNTQLTCETVTVK